MKNGVKRLFSVVALILFLGPFLGNEIHSLSHLDDEHCTQTGLHFHAEEHHCRLCDFVLPVSLSPVECFDVCVTELPFITVLFSGSSTSALSVTPSYFSLRGPPVV